MEHSDGWDVVRDLHFLFATDDELHDELAYVCDLFSDSTSDTTPMANDASSEKDAADDAETPPVREEASTNGPPAVPTTKRRVRVRKPTKNTSRARQQEEMKTLRAQVDALKDQLDEAKKHPSVDMSVWERAARDQLYAKSKAMQENEQLRAAVVEQATFIDDMTRLLRKKPRLTLQMDPQSEAWLSYKLAAQASLRVAAIHAIADRQYRHQETEFIKAGLFHRADDVIRADALPQPNGKVIVQYVYHVTLAAPCRLVGAAVWKVLRGEHAMTLPDGAHETVEELDACTIYRQFTRVCAHEQVLSAHSNLIFKYYVEAERELFVWQSVLDDALVPHMTHGSVHQESGWIQVAPLEDTSTCRLTLLLNIVADPLHEKGTGTVDELLEVSAAIFEKLSFREPPDAPGLFPGTPAKVNVDEERSMSFAKRTFVQRGKALELALKDAINRSCGPKTNQVKGHTFLVLVFAFGSKLKIRRLCRRMANEAGRINTWSIVNDLPFLFASDDQLNDDLAYVCDLLSDSTSDPRDASSEDDIGARPSVTAPPPRVAAKKPKRSRPTSNLQTNPSRDRKRREIKELRRQVDVLKDALLDAKRRAGTTTDMPAWERAAREQLFLKSKAMQENEQLRETIQDQASFIDDMTRLLRKKPRLTTLDVHSEAWREYKLAAQTSLRLAAIHAITDRQYARQQTAFIQAGVYDRAEDTCHAGPIPQPDGRVLIERVYHVTLVAPRACIGAAVWKALNGDRRFALPDGAVETFEKIDPHTVYRAFHQTAADHASAAHWNFIFKQYVEEERDVIVWRSVMDDALVPRMPEGIVHDESGWLVVAPLSPTTSRLTLVLNIIAEARHDGRRLLTDELVDVTADIIDKFSFNRPPDVPGTFPGAPPKPEATATTLPFAKRAFVERGKQIELTLKRVIDDAISDFQRTQPLDPSEVLPCTVATGISK
ncbi:Aste57867_23738 [Aphanomyces stellatus]|uniref:Aste57867_23738 protein n=1 Tax=Aphanomyces stellatus TaxID=120398 RepID=A0A485LPK5_9STRA|nr:hypothetical protein As57867_023666 [Aphanomyces stellatus]VFU00383.1 Aste57867_23738 [Aphanomyces stellatus]